MPEVTASTLSSLKEKINNLMNERYRNHAAFETFANELMKIGITRMTFDALKDEMSFYTDHQFVHSLIRTDLSTAGARTLWTLGKTLDIPKLEQAIKQLDAGNLPATEFHRVIFSAGVIFCNLYLTLQKIYYMGSDGQYYLEQY